MDGLLLDPVTAADPAAMWQKLEPLTQQIGMNFQAFQLATTRVCERLNTARQKA